MRMRERHKAHTTRIIKSSILKRQDCHKTSKFVPSSCAAKEEENNTQYNNLLLTVLELYTYYSDTHALFFSVQGQTRRRDFFFFAFWILLLWRR
jgi:hypothetical protein